MPPRSKNGKTQQQPKPPQPQNVATGIRPSSILFLSGPYKGKRLNMGTAIIESSHDQSADWQSQQGHSIRVGKNFRSISARTFQLKLEFYSETEDISPLVENVATLHEIDEETGFAPTLHYSEGSLSVAPVVCTSFKPRKEHPFPGARGFHYATVDVVLELLGGKTSEHRFAKPLTDTELTQARASQTKAERERQGRVATAEQVLAKCLSPQENKQITDLLENDKLNSKSDVLGLSSGALVQAAVAGLIPATVLQDQNVQLKLSEAVAAEMARKTDGVATYAPILQQVILGKAQAGSLPADLQTQAADLAAQHRAITKAILNQALDQNSEIFARAATAKALITVASCGITMRQSGASSIKSGNDISPEWREFFESKLSEQANDPAAREKYVLEELNKALNSNASDEDIQKQFGLKSKEQTKALRDGKPYPDKASFVKAAGQSGIEGWSAWSAFIDAMVAQNPPSSTPGL